MYIRAGVGEMSQWLAMQAQSPDPGSPEHLYMLTGQYGLPVIPFLERSLGLAGQAASMNY